MEAWKAFDGGAQFNIFAWPRRSGKDVTSFCMMVNRALTTPGNYYYLFPTGMWAQRALWDNICDWAGGKRLVDLLCPPEVVKKKNNTEYYIDLNNGSRIKLGGTDNLDFVGQGGAGYVLSEYSLHKDVVTSFLMPILDQGNAWIIANGTMRGKHNPLYQLWDKNRDREGWFTQWYTLEDTKTNYWINEEEGLCINPELVGRVDPLDGGKFKNVQEYVDSGMMSFALARQEFLNLADGATEGCYYSYEMRSLRDRGGVRKVDPMSDIVYTFWDLGGTKDESDSTAIVFAHCDVLGGKYTVVDYYEGSGHLRGHYWDVVESKGYRYGGHFYPHDGKRVTNTFTGENSADTARDLYGVDLRFIPKTQNTMNDIEVTRRGLANTSFADTPEVERLMEHVSSYHENRATGKPCHKNNCLECNGASHGADAFRYMHMALHLGLVEPYLDPVERAYKTPEFINDDYFIC